MYFAKSATFAAIALTTSVGAFAPLKTQVVPSTNSISEIADVKSLPKPAKQNSYDHALMAGRGGAKDNDTMPPWGVDNGINDLIAPGIYSIFVGLLVAIFYQLRDAIGFQSFGVGALSLVTVALIWDNFIIALGSLFFRDVHINDTKFNILKTLSFPRFTLHAVGVPLQCVTVAEIGKFAGIGFLQNDLVQYAIIAVAFVVAILDRKKFVESPGIELDFMEDPKQENLQALERDLVKFTYKKVEFAYLIPVFVLCFSTLGVGWASRDIEGMTELSNWMLFGSITSLIGNALPGPINSFTGNLGEVGLQYGLLNAVRIVFAGN